MEPMALGSPVHADNSTSPYLPQFLTGDADPINSPLSRPTIASPPSPGRTGRFGSFSNTPQKSFTNPFSPADNRINSRGTPTTGVLTQAEKGSGPPTIGLFDTLNPVTVPGPQYQSPNLPGQTFYEANLNASLLASSPLPSRQQQWCQSESISSNWVTVFGFPPSASSTILSHFSRFGTLVDKQLPVQGNWMHLCYQTKVEVRRALSNNGKIFGGDTMVGVMPCTDPAIMRDCDKENLNISVCAGPSGLSMPSTSSGSSMPSTSSAIPSTPTSQNTSTRFASPYSFNDSLRGARPLRPTCTEVLSPQSTPQRSSSFVSKAMDYVFNW